MSQLVSDAADDLGFACMDMNDYPHQAVFKLEPYTDDLNPPVTM